MTFEEALEKNGRIVYTNKGISMLPLLREDRDLMIIEPLHRRPEKYDALLFKRPGVKGRGAYVLHRMMKDYEDGTYFIIGDNCIGGERVKEENILGILTAVKRDNKLVQMDDSLVLWSVKVWWFLYPVRMVYKKGKLIFYRVGHFVKRKVLKIK